MRTILIQISLCLLTSSLIFAQNVGINTDDPQGDLHIVSPLLFQGPQFNGFGNDDLYVSYESYTGDGVKTYIVQATDDYLDPNLFMWSDDGGWNWTTDVAMSTSPVALSHGISVNWDATTGHYYGDTWQWTVGKDLDGLIVKDGAVGIGTGSPDPSAGLDIVSNRGGVLIPRLSQSERYNIDSPATGLLVYQTDDNKFYYYDGLNWLVIGSGANPVFHRIGTVVRQLGYQGTDDFVFGNNSLTGTNDTMFFFDKSKGAFRNGIITNSNWQPASIGDGSFATGTSTKASGKNSFAAGAYATASGIASASIGSGIASGGNATALGDATIASGEASIAMGYESKATGFISLATGSNCEANGDFSTAFGVSNYANADYSTVLGVSSRALGDYSLVAGNQVKSFAGYETVLGRYSTEYIAQSATGWNTADRLFVIGNGTTSMNRHNALTMYKSGDLIVNGDQLPLNGINQTGQFIYYNSNKSAFRGGELDGSDDWSPMNTGDASFGFGYNTLAQGFASAAVGANTQALGSQSFAMGNGTLASGVGAMAWGSNTEAVGERATAWGTDTYAGADWSTTFGYINEANGEGSTAWGSYNFANGDYATVSGYKNYAESFGETVLGQYNSSYTALGADTWNPADRLLVAGNGADASNRHNALTLYKNGTLLVNGDALPANGVDVTAEFLAFDAENHAFRGGRLLNSDAWSEENRGEGSFGYGRNTRVSGDYATAFGYHTQAPSYLETVLGRHNTTYTPAGLGTWEETDRLFVIGNGGSSLNENNALTLFKNGDLIVDGDNIPENGEYLTGSFLLYNKDKYALRGGELSSSDDWSPENTGVGSLAFGHDVQAKGDYSIALSDLTTASGTKSMAWGERTTASGALSTVWGIESHAKGDRSTAWGNTKAESYLETTLGRWNTDYTPASQNSWDESDRLFVIGNGTSAFDRHNALTLMKNGDLLINDDVIPENGVSISGDYLFYDKDQAAFRGGSLDNSTDWSPENTGFGSFAFGLNTSAIGDFSTALGDNTTAYSFAETVLGAYNTPDLNGNSTEWDFNDRLFVVGNGVGIFQKSNALTILKNGKVGIGTDLPGQVLEVQGKIQVGDDDEIPGAGTIRWNDTKQDFEGYNGDEWLSLTRNTNGSFGVFLPDVVQENDKVTASDPAMQDWFGSSVSIFGSYAVIGSPSDDDGGEDSGSAYIFHRDGNSWLQQAKLTASDAGAQDLFGQSVSISGNYVIIGAPGDDDEGPNSGSAYIFNRDGSIWTQQAKLTAYDAEGEEWFGTSVSISGNFAIIGAYKDDEFASNAGSAYIYYRSVTGWTLDQKIISSDPIADAHFGVSVSISGDYVIVGSPYGEVDWGTAEIFFKDGSAWIHQERISVFWGWGDKFGSSVSISGDYALIGEPVTEQGYIYYRNSSTWALQATLIASNSDPDDQFGCSVSLSGDYAVIGADHADPGGSDSGSAYIFQRNGSDWSQLVKLTASDLDEGDWFGTSVAISGDNVIVGASADDDSFSNSGSAYFFSR